MDIESLITLARPRDGIFTRFDAHARGVTSRQLRQLRQGGVIDERYPGVFAFTAIPVTPRGQIRAAVAAGGGMAAAGYSSAALLLGIDENPRGRPEIITRARVAPQLHNARVHRTRALPASDLTTREGIVTTTGPRTVVDLSTCRDRLDAIDAVDRAICARAGSRASIHQRATAMCNGRAGVSNVLEVTAPGADGVFWSALERLFGDQLRRTDLPQPQLNAPLRHRGRLIVVDGLWPQYDLVVELNGLRFHSLRHDRLRDDDRANVMAQLRLRLLVYSWRDITERFDDVAAEIRSALQVRGFEDAAGR